MERELSEIEKVLSDAERARRLVDLALPDQFREEELPFLFKEQPQTFAYALIQALKNMYEDLRSARNAVRSDPNAFARISAAMGELVVRQVAVAKKYFPEADAGEIGQPTFWMSGEERGALNNAIDLGLPLAINTTNFPSLIAAKPVDILRLQLRACDIEIADWQRIYKNSTKLGLETGQKDEETAQLAKAELEKAIAKRQRLIEKKGVNFESVEF
jgi:hypothetical protein